MPRLEEIKRFLSTLTSLGNEPEILAAWGESLEGVPIPDQELSEDIKNLFDDVEDLDEIPQEAFPPEEEDFGEITTEGDLEGLGEEPLDFSALFDDPEPDTDPSEDAAPETFDFEDLSFPDEDEPEALEEDVEAAADPGEMPELPEDFDFDDLSFSDEDEGETEPEEETGTFDLEEELAAFSDEDPPEEHLDFPLSPDEPAAEPDQVEDDPDGFDLGDFAFPDAEEDGEGEILEELPQIPEGEPEAPDTSVFSFDLPSDEDESLEFSDEEDQWGEETPGTEELESLGMDLEDGGQEEFSLGDFGKEFGLIDEGEDPEDDDWIPSINIPESAPEYIESAREEDLFSLSQEEFESLKIHLGLLPLNVKIAVEEIVAEEKGEEDARIELIRALVQGKSPRAVAGMGGKILGKTLRVPKSYEKRTGLEYEAERDSFAYIFREHILPVLRVVLLASVALAVFSYSSYQFVYKPIKANSLYKAGLLQIQGEDYRGGNRLFSQAYALWQDKKWFFRYAEGFAEKRQYRLTREKYDDLLALYEDFIHRKTEIRTERKKDKYFVQGSVDYAAFESQTMENFEKAEKILKRLLDTAMYSYPGLLAAGDNYTRWAESDPERFEPRYEDARNSYSLLLDHYGGKDEILFRLLEIAVRTDDGEEVLALKDHFQGKKRAQIDSYRYAELGGWLIDKNLTEDAADILFRSMDADKNVPEVHYHLARYFSKKGDLRDQRRALDNADLLYSRRGPLNRRGLWRWVDSSARSGELYYEQGEFLAAEKAFREGIGRYEDGLRKTLLKKDPSLGRLYEKLGDIAYYQSGHMEEALRQYRKAEDSLVRNPDLFYKKGFILYTKEEPAQSLREFIRTEGYYPSNRNLLYALANSNYQRHNYSAAEGYYSFLAEKLEADRRRVGDLLPELRSSDRALTLNMIKVYNNLGVVLFKLGERAGNRERSSQALVYWTTAQELSENLFRDSESLARRDVKNLPYLNMRQILRPMGDYELQIYHSIPLDLDEVYF